jgi:pimeloyl-ACP methyl ester carboxylesterase
MQLSDGAGTTLMVVLTALILILTVVFLGYRLLRRYVHIIIEVMDNQAWVPENGNGNSDSGPWLGEEVSFSAADGHPLTGSLMRGATGPRSRWMERGIIIFAHEYGSDRSSAQRYCRFLVDSGFDVFALDFRGHGGSPPQASYRPRQWPTDRETADMRGAIRYVKELLRKEDRPNHIGLFGLSRGACSAIVASAEEPDVRAIVADGAYSSDTAMEFFMRRFATIFARIRVVAENHPPIFWKLMRTMLFREYARRSSCVFPSVRKTLQGLSRMPVLFIHGEKDSYIPIAQSQFLYDLARGPKSIWIVPDARHNQCMKIDPAGYARRIVQFLSEHVSLEARTTRISKARFRVLEPASAAPSLVPSLVSAQFDTSATTV